MKISDPCNSIHCIEHNNLSVEPNWLVQPIFEAQTSTSDKVGRVFNNFIFGGSLYGLYSISTGGTGFLAYASYMSMGLAARKIVSTIIGYLAYPAAFFYILNNSAKLCEKQEIQNLEADNFIVKKISLYKSGTKFDAMLITHPDTIDNGNWTINALGNCMAMEFHIADLATKNFSNKCNTMLVNGPSVSQSGGWPTRYQMGAGFEAGISFLESAVKARRIIMQGLSLGGGMMGEAILQHDFSDGMKKGIRYLSITDRSFSRLSTIAGMMVSQRVKPIFYLTGTELDGVAAAQKLSKLGIQQIVIQHISRGAAGTDDVISDNVSLTYELRKEAALNGKIFLESETIRHNDPLPRTIENSLSRHIQEFMARLGDK